MDQMSYQNMLNALRASGHRLTPQRRAICRVLAESKEHPSAQMIFEILHRQDDSLSLGTVYNTLDALTRLGVVTTLGEVGDSDSTRYDADTGPHVNLACIRCSRIIDIESSYVHQLAAEIEQTSGYALLGARVLYYGICPDCQAINSPAKNENKN